MKIRTRLLLSILPALAGGILLLIISLLSSRLLATGRASLIDQVFIDHINLAFTLVGLLGFITIASLYFIAAKISAPIQKLNNSALAIAAGRYGESIEVKGPKELQELANTLNTMSECLLENINRLKANSRLQERIYGEAECARLLQHLMLQKNIDECPSDAIAVKAITFSSADPRGLLLDFPATQRPEILNIHLAEATQDGFEGMYQLLTHYKLSKDADRPFQNKSRKVRIPFPTLSLSLDRERALLMTKASNCAPSFLWSISRSGLEVLGNKRFVEAGDFIILMNQGLWSFFKGQARISEIFNKVLKHFAKDGLETTLAMLQKEISFATKRKDLNEDLHLICIQLLKPLL